MEYYVRHGGKLGPKDPLVLVGLHEGDDEPLPAVLAEADARNGGTIARLRRDGEFRGKGRPPETVLVHLPSGGPRRVLLHGLGPRATFDAEVLRRSLTAAVRAAQKARVAEIVLVLPANPPEAVPLESWVRTAAESVALAAYSFQAFKGAASREALKDQVEIRKATLFHPGRRTAAVERGLTVGRVLGDALALARDLGNAPSNDMTPTRLAEKAREAGKRTGLKVTVWGPRQIEAARMGGLLGVARGSEEPPRFIVMEHRPARAKVKGIWCIVGKGLTFDTGGISIKPSAAMDEMKFDMCGGAATIAVLFAVGALDLPLHVIGIVPSTENMPGGRSYKPGDVLTICDGTTVEVLNTDAEGRLILADGLAYAVKRKPRAIVDMATLTGACVVALGHHLSGLVSNDDDLAGRLLAAGKASGDPAWRLPLTDDYREQLKSSVADVKNVAGRDGGAITAGAFLEKFVDGRPWAHLDIAGTAWTPSGSGPDARSATGAGVRIVTQYLIDVAAGRG